MPMGEKTYLLEYGGVKQKFARSVVVGDLVFLSGSSGRTMETGEVSSDDVRDQTRVAYDKIKGALEEAGSSLENIVKVHISFKDIKDYEAVKQTEYEYFNQEFHFTKLFVFFCGNIPRRLFLPTPRIRRA